MTEKSRVGITEGKEVPGFANAIVICSSGKRSSQDRWGALSGGPEGEGFSSGGSRGLTGSPQRSAGTVQSGLLPREPPGQVGRRPGPCPSGLILLALVLRACSGSSRLGFMSRVCSFISRQRRPTVSRKNLKKPQRKYAVPSSSWPPRSDAPAALPGPRWTASLPRLGPRCRRLLWAPSRALAKEDVGSLNQNA